jgi:hypothetical protein
MSMWFYQLSENEYPSRSYRLDIWENTPWAFGLTDRKITGADGNLPRRGDRVVFFYAPTGCPEPGYYGWAIVIESRDDSDGKWMFFRPTAPSDRLKMYPWGDDEARKIADDVRAPVWTGTLWLVPEKLAVKIGAGILSWSGKPSAGA